MIYKIKKKKLRLNVDTSNATGKLPPLRVNYV